MAGIVIGLTLTLVHIIGVPLTWTSVNPARSLAPAQVWVFIVTPLIGVALAAIVFKSKRRNLIQRIEHDSYY